MVNLELMNKGELDTSEVSHERIGEIQSAFSEIDLIKSKLLTNDDTYTLKSKTYINKRWYRKLAVAFSISTQIISEDRVQNGDDIIYNFTMRASTPLWRYVEASSSCSSIERDFNNVEHEVRAVSQTRASNRAIGELIWLSEVTYIGSSNNIAQPIKEDKQQDVSDNTITAKQKRLLIKLIESKYSDEASRSIEYKKIHSMTKNAARVCIRDLIEGWVEY